MSGQKFWNLPQLKLGIGNLCTLSRAELPPLENLFSFRPRQQLCVHQPEDATRDKLRTGTRQDNFSSAHSSLPSWTFDPAAVRLCNLF